MPIKNYSLGLVDYKLSIFPLTLKLFKGSNLKIIIEKVFNSVV